MRRLSLRLITGSVLVSAACAAAIFGFAGSGRAASPNICATSTDLTTGTFASCVTQLVLPHKVNFGGFSQSVVRFKNEGGSTASHVSLQTAFDPGVAIDQIRLLLNGAVQSTSSCTISSTLVKCADFANFAPGDTGKLVVRFSLGFASTTAVDVKVTSTVFYAESGNDNKKGSGGPNSTKNDQQQAKEETVTFVPEGDPASGSCEDAGGTFTDGNALQTTTIFYNQTTDGSLICTPADAGVDPTAVPGLKTLVSFVELVAQGGPGYATVNLDFTPLPPNTTLKDLAANIKEALPPLFDFSTFIVVPPCSPSGLPPHAGTPPSAGPPQVNDACVFDKTSLPKGGGRVILHVIGGTVDPRFGS